MYHIIRYKADKPSVYNGENLLACGDIQYSRENKDQAEQILTKLYEISANQKNMNIIKRTRYTFKCENKYHKYMFKITQSDNKPKEKLLGELYL